MKKILVIAVALASVNAFATRARVSSLGNSPHLVDTQTVYSNPADMFELGGDYATIETGKTVATSTEDGAEGMVVRSMGDSKMGLSLGHDSDVSMTLRGAAAAAFPSQVNYHQQNPLELSYGMKAGDMAWAGTLVYSKYQSKTGIEEKEDTMGARFGMNMGPMKVMAGLGLANNYENKTDGKFKGTSSISAGFQYQMDTMFFNVGAATAGFKTENAAGTETAKMTAMTIDAKVTSVHKKDGNEFFYGAGLSSSETKESVADTKATSLTMPVWMGFEADANSWLVMRASVTQNVLIDQSKTTAGATTVSEFSPGANNTVAAVGAGLKFNKVTLDGSLEGLTGGAATQKLNANTLLATVGLSYWF